MYQPITIFIGIRYVFNNKHTLFEKSTFFLSAIGIFIGILSLIIILSIMNGFEYKLENNIIKFIPHALVTNNIENIDPDKNPVSSIKLKGIRNISSLITAEVLLQSKHNISIANMLGIQSYHNHEPLIKYLINKDPVIIKSGSYQIILGAALALKMRVNKGDKVNLIIPSVNYFTILGRIPSNKIFTVGGIFDSHSEADEYQIIINQTDAAKIMNYNIKHITGWRLFLKQPLDINHFSNQKLPSGLILKDWREKKGELFQAIQIEKNIMTILLSLIIIVAAFNIISSLNLIITEKRNDIAILKTLGLTKKQIIAIFMIQGSITGIIGVFLGVLLGILITNNLNYILSRISWLFDLTIYLPIYIDYCQILIISLMSIFIILLSTIYPSWYASSIEPNEIMKYE